MQYWLHSPDIESLSSARIVGVDTETHSLKDRTLLGTGVAFNDNAVYATPDDPMHEILISILRDPKVVKVYQNAPFDLRVLREYGIDSTNIHDTAIMARMAALESAVLEDLSEYVPASTEKVANFLDRLGVKNMVDAPFEETALKCCNDALVTLQLLDYLKPLMLSGTGYYQTELLIVHQLDTMSKKGIAIDQELRGELEDIYGRRFTSLRLTGEAEWGVKLGSNKEVAIMLGEDNIFLPLTKSRKNLSVSKDVLETIDHPLAEAAVEYRFLQKMLSSYLKKMRGQDRIYTFLHMEAVTGRISSSSAGKNNLDMNLQNIPRKAEKGDATPMRHIFLPDDEVFTRFDLSQIELRTLAYISGDQAMQDIMNDPAQDLHASTAIGMFGSAEKKHRDNAKTFNFAMVYGDKPSALSKKLKVSINDAKDMFDSWGNTFPTAMGWINERREEAHNYPYAETLYGRKIPLPPAGDYPGHMENCAVNYVIQGSAAEIFKRIMLNLHSELPAARLQIHDEMLYDSDVEIRAEELSHISPFWTPLELEQMSKWGVEKEK